MSYSGDVRGLRVAILISAAAPVACSLFVDLSGLDDGAPLSEAGSEAAVTDASSDGSVADGPSCTADTNKDPLNCGSCGHSCFGGDCSNGICSSLSLTSATGLISALVCDDTAVYFTLTTGTGTILRKTLDLTPATTLVSGNIPNATSPFGLGIDATYIYFFSSAGGNQLARVAKTSTTVETVAFFSLDFDDLPEAIAVNDAGIFATTYYQDDDDGGGGGSRIWAFDALDGGANILLAQQAAGYEDIVTDGKQLYFSSSAQMNALALTGGTATAINASSFRPQQNTNLGTNSTGIAWATDTAGAVQWIASAGQNVGVIEPGSGVASVAMDEQSLYAAVVNNDDASDYEGTIVASSLASDAQATLASMQNNPRLLIRCPSYLAWVVDDFSNNTSAVAIIAH